MDLSVSQNGKRTKILDFASPEPPRKRIRVDSSVSARALTSQDIALVVGQQPLLSVPIDARTFADPKPLTGIPFPLSSAAQASAPRRRLRPSASASTLASDAGSGILTPGSAKFNLCDARHSIIFSLPVASVQDGANGAAATIPTPTDDNVLVPMPLACSAQNVIYFGRANNRVCCRDMISGEPVIKLFCKLKNPADGVLKLLAAGDRRLALSTTTGCIQIWDTEAKKMLSSWGFKSKKGGSGVACMAWFGPFLAVGGAHGVIRVYDTRIGEVSKMKDKCVKMIRHEAAICALEWNVDGRMLASGDESGMVLCWDMAVSSRERLLAPLEVGDHVQRRKKIVHSGTIMALAWCPWSPKLLATGDASGTLNLWTIEANTTYTNAGTKVDLGSRITSLHFSPIYKEIVCALGERVATDPVPSRQGGLSNEVVVYSVPALCLIANTPVSSGQGQEGGPVQGAVLCTGSGTHRLVVAVPREDKLKVYEVWGKQKELKRHSSFVGTVIIR